MKIRDIKLGFLSAALNQYTFDEISYSFFHRSIAEFGGIPRPSKWISRNTLLTKALNRTSSAVNFLWSYLFAYLFFTFKALNYLIKRKRPSNLSCNRSGRPVALAICDRSFEVMKQTVHRQERILWLELPKGSLSHAIREGEDSFIDCLSILDPHQILHALLVSIQVHASLIGNKNKNLVMQSYAALDWILMLTAIEKLSPKELIIAEHHDRWAALADYYCSAMRISGASIDFVLVQHGVEHEQTYCEIRSKGEYKELPYRLRSVTEAYFYDENQFRIFKECILDNARESTSALKVNFYRFRLKTFDFGYDGVVVMFVGHPSCEQFQADLYRKISRSRNCCFLYKPHPTVKNLKTVSPGWILIQESSQFPKVDLLVAYPSTLVDEYRNIGVDSFVHPLRSADCDLEKSAAELIMKLDLIALARSK